MMSKIHARALRELVKPLMAESAPDFEISKEAAKFFSARKDLAYEARHGDNSFYMLFDCASSAVDDYFVLDIAWVRNRSAFDALTFELFSEANFGDGARTREALLTQNIGRQRADFLWEHKSDSVNYSGAFHFPTPATRYNAEIQNWVSLGRKPNEEESISMLSDLMREESEMTVDQAKVDLIPSVKDCFEKIGKYVIPFLRKMQAK
jgi:hypothetical protein